MTPRDLPIYELEQDLIRSLGAGGRCVIKAPTGSGKSTQIPQIVLDRSSRNGEEVLVLEPRRIAARMLARRVAHERGSVVGGEVGYQVRFENVTGPSTRIRFITEGILLREMTSNPSLSGIGAVIFDEFHERHLYGDVTLGHCLSLQETGRPDLRVLVMSATVDTGLVESFLAPCDVLVSEGRTFPVDIAYLPRPVDAERTPVWDLAAMALEEAVAGGADGDALVFMPGAFEITRTVEILKASRRFRDREILPLHGELPAEVQDRAVGEATRPKVVVATNVAESSLTIEGVRLVVDSGLARIPRFDPHRGINTLLIQKISQASAEQRAGRAGRTSAGRCIRLWTRREHGQRPLEEIPEVKRLDLAEVALTLKALGMADLGRFRWIEAPEPLAIARTESLLRELGAVDGDGRITETGRRMLAFPVHPRFSRMLLAGQTYGCVSDVVLIAALTQGRPLLARRTGSSVREKRQDLPGENHLSDFFLLMSAWQRAEESRYDPGVLARLGINAGAARQVGRLRTQFAQIARGAGLHLEDVEPAEDAVRKCIMLGFSDHLALRRDAGTLRCALVHGRSGELSRESVVRNEPLFVAGEVTELETHRGGQRRLDVRLSLATAIEESWLQELYPEDFTEDVRTVYDPALKRVLTLRERRFRDLVLESRTDLDVPPEAAAAVLASEVSAGRLRLSQWDETVERWIARVNCLSAWRPDWSIPSIGAEDRIVILQQVCLGARSHKDLKTRPVMQAVKSWLSPSQQDLVERFAPERVLLPGGRRAKISYQEGAAPRLSATIQDLFGLREAPAVADGRVRLLIEVLAPNRRPVQVTDDMASFWRDAYPALKQQYRRRYPKHEWR